MISVVMPSYLGSYRGAASDRPAKLRRAIESFLSQGLGELIVVADGCNETVKIAKEYPVRIFLFHEKQPTFSGDLRQVGINLAKYDWITYLDSDDLYGPNHLSKVTANLVDDWVWWDDYRAGIINPCRLEKNHIGTSCIAHRRSLPAYWGHGYKHDWYFIQQLLPFKSSKIFANYHVMHVPGLIDG